MYMFFSYKIDCYYIGLSLFRFLFVLKGSSGHYWIYLDLLIQKGSFFSNILEYMLYIRKITKSSVTSNSIC